MRAAEFLTTYFEAGGSTIVFPAATCGSLAGVTSDGEADVSGEGETGAGFTSEVCAKVLHKQQTEIIKIDRMYFIKIFTKKLQKEVWGYKSPQKLSVSSRNV